MNQAMRLELGRRNGSAGLSGIGQEYTPAMEEGVTTPPELPKEPQASTLFNPPTLLLLALLAWVLFVRK